MSRFFTLLGLVAILVALVLCLPVTAPARMRRSSILGLPTPLRYQDSAQPHSKRWIETTPRRPASCLLSTCANPSFTPKAWLQWGEIQQPIPSIRAGMARAGAYAAQHDPRVSDAAKRVFGVLGPDPAAGTQ